MDQMEACRQEAEKWKKWEKAGAFRNMDRERAEKDNLYRQACVRRFASLYREMDDEALLGILRSRAAELGRNPNRREVFPVYHIFLRMRFKNWPSALRAAGLKPPKEKKRYENRNKSR